MSLTRFFQAAALLALLALVSGGVCWAGQQIDVTTYYDVPEGDFRDLTVTGNGVDDITLASTAGNVTIATGGGFTSIGAGAAAGPQPLVVRGNLNNLATAAFLDGAGNGVNLGGGNGTAYGLVQGRTGAAESALRLNPSGGSVAIGGNYAAATAGLQISDAAGGNGSLGITTGGNTGEVRVAWAQDGYYATYAA